MRKEANAWSYHECIWETLVMRKGNHNAMTIISDDQNFFPSIIFLKLEVHTQNLMIWLSNENDIQLWWLTQFLKYTVNTFFFALGRVVFFHRVILPTYFHVCTVSIWIDFEETATILLWKIKTLLQFWHKKVTKSCAIEYWFHIIIECQEYGSPILPRKTKEKHWQDGKSPSLHASL